MKKKIILSSILIVLMLIILPSTTSIQLSSGLQEAPKHTSFAEIKNMEIDELLDLMVEITEDYPQIYEEISKQIEKLDREANNEIEIKQADSNVSIFQKIWELVFKYRMFRFSWSLLVYVSFPNKITMWRAITWSIKILKWVKIGVLLGFIDPAFWKQPPVPQISFEMDLGNNTLTVEYVYPENVSWDDIDQIGAGSCDPLPTGTVMVGDEITNCAGIIILRYIPYNQIIGYYDFS